MVDSNVSVPEVALFYSCGATSESAQTPRTGHGQFPYAKRRPDVEQSGITRIRRMQFGCYTARLLYGSAAEHVRFQ